MQYVPDVGLYFPSQQVMLFQFLRGEGGQAGGLVVLPGGLQVCQDGLSRFGECDIQSLEPLRFPADFGELYQPPACQLLQGQR